ncbi:MAG: helix-turn-helix transcriptional regulator [Clostridia bacterium]|nr:helix-turn-helix transcriptional regulator [Clostridia bacterium]
MDTNILDGSTVFDPGRVKITGTRSAHSTPRFFHIQKFWEFIYIDKGFALLGGNGESVLLSEGDLAVVTPGENHSLVCPGNTGMHCLLFEDKELGSMKDEIFSLPGFLELSIRARVLDDIGLKAKNSKFECIRLDFSERQEFVRLCDGVMNERIYKGKGWQQLVKSYLCQSLVFYSRLDIPAKRAEKASDGSKGIYSMIIKYLEENYKTNITGAEIASQLGYTPEYLSKQFKSELDISPADYLRRYRVAKSMELLCGTDMPVSDVARECGFVDMSSFSRVFKAFEGDTPSAYRKRCRYGI